MIKLNKLNGIEILVNSDQIEYVESIPESKLVMMNGEYLLVTDTKEEIIDKVVEFKRRCYSMEEDIIRQRILAGDPVKER